MWRTNNYKLMSNLPNLSETHIIILQNKMSKISGPLKLDAQFSPGTIRLFTRTRNPLSAECPSLGCSLPGLARFTW